MSAVERPSSTIGFVVVSLVSAAEGGTSMGAPTSAAVWGPGSPTITAQSASKEKADPDKHLNNAKQRNEPVQVEPEDGVRYEFAYGDLVGDLEDSEPYEDDAERESQQREGEPFQ